MSPKPVEYAPTAWNSQNPRDLPPGLDVETLPWAQRALRKYPMNGRGVQCGEFLSEHSADFNVAELREMPDSEFDTVDKKIDQICWYWPSWFNPAAVVDAIGGVAGFFAFGSFIGGILLGLIEWDVDGLIFGWVYLFLPLYSVYYLAKVALNREWVKNKRNTEFNRCTGMVSFNVSRRKRVSYPFDEFDAFMSIGVSRSGGGNFHLRLIHRYTGASVANPNPNHTRWEAEGEWELLQAFMDTSRPLPDIPLFELMREIDPTSIEHDRRTNRPRRWWRQQDRNEVSKWARASAEAKERFPWGLTRSEAIAFGWQPSGYGDGEQIRRRMQAESEQAADRAAAEA